MDPINPDRGAVAFDEDRVRQMAEHTFSRSVAARKDAAAFIPANEMDELKDAFIASFVETARQQWKEYVEQVRQSYAKGK